MKPRGMLLRKSLDRLMKSAAAAAILLGLLFMGWILYTVVDYGAGALNLTLLFNPTKPYGIPGGGIANALIGTMMITFGAVALGVPPGLLGGIYLAEFARHSKTGDLIRFSANVLMGMPSIIVGLFVYALLVFTTRHFSGFAGSVALSVIMFPVVLRTTEDMLSMVPDELRESALALGMARWQTTCCVIFRAAKNGLITGVLLAVARVSGETAPLLFTALWSDAWPTRFFTQPTANLTVTINEYATNSPYAAMHERAWGGALLITAAILLLNICCRTIFKERKKS